MIDQGFNELKDINSEASKIKLGPLQESLGLLKHILVNVGLYQGYFTMSGNPYFERLRSCLETINSKVKSEDLTRQLHDLSLFAHHFQQFGSCAGKMAGMFKKPEEYSLNSVEAMYLQSQQPGSMPGLLDMAEMLARKYENEGHMKDEDNNQYFVLLVYRILIGKFKLSKDVAKFDAATQYLTENKKVFGIELDF